MSEYINEEETVPTIAGRRINMFDMMAALRSSDLEEQLYETWELSKDEVDAARTYIQENREYLLELEEKYEAKDESEEMGDSDE